MAERRWYVDDDRQGGSFGMSYGAMTADEWLEVAADWLEDDDAFEPEFEDEDSPWYSKDNFIKIWGEAIKKDPQEFIDFFDDYWELTMVEGERPKDHWFQDDEDEDMIDEALNLKTTEEVSIVKKGPWELIADNTFGDSNEYLILKDDEVVMSVRADSDDEAIRRFDRYIQRGF